MVRAAEVPGIRDIVPTYRSVAVYFDPLRTDYPRLMARLKESAALCTVERPPAEESVCGAAAAIQVPVCYGGEFGPDLGTVAAFGRMTEADVIKLHTSRTYRVYMLGFVPGFAYMGIVDERIAAPRHAEPRHRVPAGSVGIAGAQTAVYPSATPGGWQLVGRTPLVPFDLARNRPFLFEPGLAVQFQAIDPAGYVRLRDGR
jgi:inhibitor of KinA